MTSTPDLSTSMVPRRQPQASEVLEPGPILSAVTNPETLNPKGVLPIGQGFGAHWYPITIIRNPTVQYYSMFGLPG